MILVFSSFIFLLIFLPITILVYYVIPSKYTIGRNVVLLIASLVFYAWGDLYSLPILAGSILLNYVFALVIGKSQKPALSKAMVIIMLVFNVGLLFAFKYLSYTLKTVMRIIPAIQFEAPNWVLPLGISFFTFSAISYVLDVYFQASQAEKNVLNVALFISFFPKMVSGPIMKWEDFQKQLTDRRADMDTIVQGVQRFIIGLGKKVIISDTIGYVADCAFRTEGFSELSVLFAWFGVVAYIIQLYFDFSGYSDMAIGIGKLFGFNIDENFDYPLTAKSIAGFWATWHITLGTWVKHYIYTPVFRALSKKRNKKTGKRLNVRVCDYIALIVSWLIIGPWHGAGPKFIIYGLYNCVFILLERIFDNYKKKRKKAGKPIKENFFLDSVLPHVYFAIVIIFGQMIFRSDSLIASWGYFTAMIGAAGNAFVNSVGISYMQQYAIILVVGLLLSFPWGRLFKTKVLSKCPEKAVFAFDIAYKIALVGVLVLSIAFMFGNTYNPFIYMQF